MSAKRPVEDRLWEKVNFRGPRPCPGMSRCWLWTGALNNRGYGCISGQKETLVHRVAYVLDSGLPIPTGMTVDHLCFVPNCVRPTHLRLLTLSQNSSIKQPVELVGPNTVRHGCKKAHGPEHQVWSTTSSRWSCSECSRIRLREKRKRERDLANA